MSRGHDDTAFRRDMKNPSVRHPAMHYDIEWRCRSRHVRGLPHEKERQGGTVLRSVRQCVGERLQILSGLWTTGCCDAGIGGRAVRFPAGVDGAVARRDTEPSYADHRHSHRSVRSRSYWVVSAEDCGGAIITTTSSSPPAGMPSAGYGRPRRTPRTKWRVPRRLTQITDEQVDDAGTIDRVQRCVERHPPRRFRPAAIRARPMEARPISRRRRNGPPTTCPCRTNDSTPSKRHPTPWNPAGDSKSFDTNRPALRDKIDAAQVVA